VEKVVSIFQPDRMTVSLFSNHPAGCPSQALSLDKISVGSAHATNALAEP
jgi:hypothetical protein